MKFISSIAALCLLGLSGCSQFEETSQPEKAVEQPSLANDVIEVGKDYHSFANPAEVLVQHISLDLTADFSLKQLIGVAKLTITRVDETATTLVLDTRGLVIEKVLANGQELGFELAEPDAELGAALSITLPSDGNIIDVHYRTSEDASGVQWLTPAQTAGKKHPFLFTQAQAVHARSFIPLQDSPQVRVTYDAVIRTPEDLLAVMSAANDPDTERDGVYEFTMPQSVPSYLIALAIGDLQFKAMGQRTGVYAEPALLESAAAEFSDTESMLEVTEKTYGPYSWDRYDLLILPPSFPFGGMENPRLSFITPTVIAGDKSLVALIAHELAHSWSGNTVTNATWRDLWLNEGFTTYLTYRIMEMIFGTDRYKMEAVLGYQDLQADIASLPANDQILAIDLRGRNPDDVFSNIPYEKGALFLRELEQKVGRENFDKFLLDYFDEFAFKSITTDEFIAYLETTLLKDYAGALDKSRIEQWIFAPGIPEGAPVPESDAFSSVDNFRTQWLEATITANEIDTEQWTVHQWLYFLNNMPETLSEAQMVELDSAFGLTQSKNNEIAHSWLMMAVKNQYQPAYERLFDYLTSIGRNKLVRPLYRELSKTPDGKAFAKRAFEQAKPGYHPLTVKANQGYVE
ncbi:M1 family metallopeptidase [Aliiglaciecola sp. M165]|uniref:M1 family metallopeptidase n=1 Tax=Aliiglaciecola sp. M165 TaxID=2593649 RepID=UPI00117FD6B3|nr:M1 family metallopeptidase [Aliiglaciecola sp. M165]TRY30898.1 M1 family metallopeptidase [Aliiglaciecola sp. M165]